MKTIPKFRWFLVMLTAASLTGVPANAQNPICLLPDVSTESPYHYLLALVDALRWAKDGRDTVPATHSLKGDFFSDMMKKITAIKTAGGYYECAAAHLTPYMASNDEGTKSAAKSIAGLFTYLVDLGKLYVEEFKKLIDLGAGNKMPGSENIDRSSSLNVFANKIRNALPQMCIAAIQAVTIEEPADPATGKLGRLSLTDAQRSELLKKLAGTFGASIQKGIQNQEGQKSVEVSAAALYEFLSNTTWRSKDSQ